MRSRYTAFTRGDAEYLLRSWHPDTRPPELTLDEHQKWLGLRIKNTEAGLATDSEGQVEFVARYRRDGRAHRLHELSQFKKINGLWFYHSGVLHEP